MSYSHSANDSTATDALYNDPETGVAEPAEDDQVSAQYSLDWYNVAAVNAFISQITGDPSPTVTAADFVEYNREAVYDVLTTLVEYAVTQGQQILARAAETAEELAAQKGAQ